MGAIDGQYDVTRVLGTGAMGEAVLARTPDGQKVVVKLLKKKLRSLKE